MIQTENLTRKFGSLTAVDNLTLSVGEGEIFGLLGLSKATFKREEILTKLEITKTTTHFI